MGHADDSRVLAGKPGHVRCATLLHRPSSPVAQGPGRAEEGKGKDQIVNTTVETATVIVLWMIIAYLMWRD